jgi:hypothetical protein
MRQHPTGRSPANAEDTMSNLAKYLLSGVLLPGALLSPLLGATPTLANSKTSAEFTTETCRGAMDDLAKVDATAEEQHWTAVPEGQTGAQNNLIKLRSAYVVTRGEDKFMVVTGLSQIGGAVGTGNVCMVTYPGAKLQRNDFYNVISATLDLKPIGNMNLPQGRMEMFEIQSDGPAKLILQMMTLNDGNVMMASIGSLNAPAQAQQNATSEVDGSVRAFRGLDASIVYVLGSDGNLWREFDTWNNALQPRKQVDHDVSAFEALDASTVFVLGTDGSLWREFGTWNNTKKSRNYVDGNVEAFQALDINITYVLGTDGKLWREFGAWDNSQQPRQNVDAHVRAFQAIDASVAYVLGENGNLWRETGTWNNVLQPRTHVDGTVAAFQALDGNIVYVLGENGNLWREFGAWNNAQQPRVQVDGNVKAFQALDADVVYVLGSDGNLWREQGTMQVRTRVASNVLAFHAVDDKTVYVLCPGGVLFRTPVPHIAPLAERTN